MLVAVAAIAMRSSLTDDEPGGLLTMAPIASDEELANDVTATTEAARRICRVPTNVLTSQAACPFAR